MLSDKDLKRFLKESNKIEGILRPPTKGEVSATETFLNLPSPAIRNVTELVHAYEPSALLRDKVGVNVRVGHHNPAPGGLHVVEALETILLDARLEDHPFGIHKRFEILHAYTDGNGRSGRALWLWQMLRRGEFSSDLGFLHTWYYQSLQASRENG